MRETNTELESCVLSVIQRKQPCTAYQVRLAFESSMTTTWRASTGAIYPIVRRLKAQGLVLPVSRSGDKRGSELLSLTPLGTKALVDWVCDSNQEIAEPNPDPIRARSYALDLLSMADQRAKILDWILATQTTLDALKSVILEFKDGEDVAETRAYRATELQLAARLIWLKELEHELKMSP